MNFAATAIGMAEHGWVPDDWIRTGIRRLIGQRRDSLHDAIRPGSASPTIEFVRRMQQLPVAVQTELANQQHYEVPPEFFALALGRHRKYSSGWWTDGAQTLDQAEQAALEATCERAQLGNGQSILELGCGWGSLTLWMAARFPLSRIIAVSNSHSQRDYIQAEAARRGLHNVEVRVADMNTFSFPRGMDRIVSVEMFEHMRNWPQLFSRIADALSPDGRFFMHVFCHSKVPYHFDDEDASDWMSRYFFSGGLMPSDALAMECQQDLRLVNRWRWDGTHYQRTARAWLDNLDRNRDQAMLVLERVYGKAQAAVWMQRWRLFFMACEELFGFNQGQEWWVSHYLFKR